MTIVTSNAIKFSIGLTPAFVSGSSSASVRRLFTGTQYYYGGKPDEPPPAILAYSGCAYDPATGKIYLFGGGHHDYSGNEVWEFCVDRPQDRWVRHYVPSGYSDKASVMVDLDNATRPGMYVSSSRPIARHTYHSLNWVPAVGRVFAGGGSTWDGPDGSYWTIYPNAPGDLWSYDPNARVWNYCGSSLVDKQWPATGAMVVSGQRGTILALSGRRTRSYDHNTVSYSYADVPATVWEYSPATNTWSDHGVPLPESLDNIQLVFDPRRDELVAIGWDSKRMMRACTYDMARRVWESRTVLGSPPPAPFWSTSPREGDRAVLSTHSGRMLYVSAISDGAIFGLDPSNWTWSEILGPGVLPEIAQAFATAWCPVRHEMYVTYKLERTHSLNVVAVSA